MIIIIININYYEYIIGIQMWRPCMDLDNVCDRYTQTHTCLGEEN